MTAESLHSALLAVSDHCRPLEANETTFDVDGKHPGFLCEPTSADEIAAILGVAHRERAAVIPWGGGTRMSVGFPPRQADLVVSTSELSGIVEYEPADLTVTVQAGMRFAALQDVLRQHGQMLALDPPAAERATIGGVIASNSSGPKRLAYGTARDLVIGVRVANAEGMLTKAGGRVVKNVTGYDLNKLYTGSYGTLGVLVEISFKLHPLPQHQGTTLAVFDSPDKAQQAVQRIVKSPLNAAALTILDTDAASLLLGRSPGENGVVLLALAEGFERAVIRQTRDLAGMCEAAQSVDVLDAGEGERAWYKVRELADLTGDGYEAILKLAVPPASSAAMMETMRKIGRAHDQALACVSHAGSGVVYVGLTGCVDRLGPPSDRLSSLITEARAAATALRGSLVVERCPVEVKSEVDIWGEVGSSLRVMAALKERFDPHGILNPGRFVGHL
jgi:glycolate oxidase FAD binding subunit